MSLCYIDATTLIGSKNKSACLKIYREQDKKELSICFDNSLGAFGNECKRIDFAIFSNKESEDPDQTGYITSAEDLVKAINEFMGR